MKMKLVGLTALTLSLSGCGALFDAAYIGNKYSKDEREKAGQVKFISESQGEKSVNILSS